MSLTEKPFVSFDLTHVVTAVIVVGLAIGLPLLISAYAAENRKRWFRLILAGTIIVHLVGNIWVRVWLYGGPFQENLPLHLCSASLILSVIILLFRNYPAYEVAYFWALGGAIPAILMPDVEYAFAHPFFLLFFFGHGLELASAMFATFVLGFRPKLISVGKAIIATAVYAALILPINYILDANYLYLRRKPEQPSIIDFLGPWPWYIFALAGITVVLAFLCYLPFAAERLLSRTERGK